MDMRDGEYDLMATVLDQQLRDFIYRPMGMVDGLVLELRDGEAPRVAFIETGGVTLARRLSNPFGRWLAAAARRWGGTKGEPMRIPWARVRNVELDVEVELDADATPALHWEHAHRHLIERVLGR
jgi:hypothetical protein